MKMNLIRKAYLLLIIPLVLATACSSGTNDNADDAENATTDTSEVTETENEEKEEKERISPLHNISQSFNGNEVKIQYGAPSKKGRSIWGNLVPYDRIWRTGANEATYISLPKAAEIKGQKLEKGKYAIFTIPVKGEEWIIIFNKKWDQWGAFDYNEKEDALRIKVKPQTLEEEQEELEFNFSDSTVYYSWAGKKVEWPIKFQ